MCDLDSENINESIVCDGCGRTIDPSKEGLHCESDGRHVKLMHHRCERRATAQEDEE